MDGDVSLFATGSDGSVEQWDGLSTPLGILLRWFHRQELGFPQQGYNVYRARVPDFVPLVWEVLAPAMDGQPRYEHAGEIVFTSTHLLRFAAADSSGRLALYIPPGERVTIIFQQPAWYVSLGASVASAAPVQVELFAAGDRKTIADLGPGAAPIEWRTRGIERIELTGDGGILPFLYQLLDCPRPWQHLIHLCLPVSDPLYSCGGPFGRSDEDEARSRVPTGVNWAARYGAGFGDLHTVLRALATHSAPPALPLSGQPNAPKANVDGSALFYAGLFDPHVARIAGLAFDDPLQPWGMDGSAWAYQVTGRWAGPPWRVATISPGSIDQLREYGLRTELRDCRITGSRSSISVEIGRGGAVRFDVAAHIDHLAFEVQPSNVVQWVALGEDGRGIADGTLAPRAGDLQRAGVTGMRHLDLLGPATFELRAILGPRIPVVRRDVVPFVQARNYGPPPGPKWLTAIVSQPGGTAAPMQAELTWEILTNSDGSYSENSPVLYQIAATQLSNDPGAPQPTLPVFDRGLLLNGGASVLVATPAPPRHYRDWPVNEGWRCWWVRGVDLFGRVSTPSPPAVARFEDNAAPPPPLLVLAEYSQAGLTPQQAQLRTYSALTRSWRVARPTDGAVVAAWAWTPELSAQCPDVNGFCVYVRRPVAGGGGPLDPETTYAGVAWGPVQAQTGLVQVRVAGLVTDAVYGISAVNVTAVEQLDDTHSYCITDLSLDAGAGVLAGAELVSGAARYAIEQTATEHRRGFW